jgi:hypothetical protein
MAQVAKIDFNLINGLDNGQDLVRITKMGTYLRTLSGLWNMLAAATAAADVARNAEVRTGEITAAIKALKDSTIKVVNLQEGVFLGGSRRRRQSKKRKNHKKHNNNE